MAYFLTRHPRYKRDKHHITLLEATKIAGGASGKAGGFIASWADPPCLAGLTWQLHMDLAMEYDGASRWGYRRCRLLDCDVELQGRAGSESPLETISPVPHWIYSDRLKTCAMRGNGTYGSAQVQPYRYTTTLAEQAKARGVEIIIGSATSIAYTEDGKAVKSVNYRLKDSQDIHELPADYVIAAAGPWTPTILPKVPVTGARNNSIHLSVPTNELSADLVFFNNVAPDTWFPRVKLYPRPDDTIHISAGTDHKVPLPPSTDLIEIDRDLCDRIRRVAEFLSGELQGRKLLVEQACYRPVVTIPGRDRSQGPLLGHTAVSGLILATGHDNWGIQNSPATGVIVSELVFDGVATSADISSLDPGDVV